MLGWSLGEGGVGVFRGDLRGQAKEVMHHITSQKVKHHLPKKCVSCHT